jgi:hypothetical protein
MVSTIVYQHRGEWLLQKKQKLDHGFGVTQVSALTPYQNDSHGAYQRKVQEIVTLSFLYHLNVLRKHSNKVSAILLRSPERKDS